MELLANLQCKNGIMNILSIPALKTTAATIMFWDTNIGNRLQNKTFTNHVH